MAQRFTGGNGRKSVAGWAAVVIVGLIATALPTRAQSVDGSNAEPVPTTIPKRSARLVFGGDVLPHLNVVRVACRPNKRCDFARLLEPTRSVVESADWAVCHLEVPLIRDGQQITGYPTFGSPRSVATGLKAVGWDHCSTASNHSLDRGVGGIASTIDALQDAGITHVGTATTKEESETVRTFTVKGIRIAHLAATYGLNGFRLPKGQAWRVHRINPATIRARAAAAKAAGADVVIVSLHWGTEYQHAPSAYQRKIASALMSSPDVDLIVGHHAHVVQPISQVDGRWVVFGMGNHLSGQIPVGRKLRTQDGFLAEINILERDGGGFDIARPIAHPTWNDPSTKVVYLAENSNSAGARRSAARTAQTVRTG